MRRANMRILLVGLAASLSCDEPTHLAPVGGMALHVELVPGAPLILDSGRIRVRGPTNRDVRATPGETVTIDQLQPGTYSVALEGFFGDEVGYFGQTSGVTVVAGQNTPASVTFSPFEAAPPVFPDTFWIGTRVTVNIDAVSGAASYQVEWSQDPAFGSGVSSVPTVNPSVQITVATYAVYFIRIRAVDPFQLVGVPGEATRLRIVQSGPARRLAFTAQPSTTTAGSMIAPAVTVTVQDSLGNTATGFVGSVTIALGTNPGGGTLSGTTTAAANAGVAAFATLSIDKAGTGYTLTAAASGLTGATSDAFGIQAASATQLAFTAPPTHAAAGAVITPAVVVTARDAFGNTATGFGGTVTMAIETNPSGSGTLSGTTAVAAAAGAATFTTLSIDVAGSGYTLIASAGSLTAAVSGAFNITAGAATRIALDAGDNQTATVNTAVAIGPSVVVRDAFDNPVAGVSVTFAVASGGGSVTGADATTGTGGIARVGSWTLGTAAGSANNTLTATAAGLAGSPVTFTASATAGAAAQLVFSGQPSNTLARGVIAPAVVVTAEDAFGNMADGFAGDVSVAIGANPPGNGVLSGTTTRSAVSGVATFGDLSIDQAGTGYTLRATAAGTASATSAPFRVLVQLAFTVQPSSTLAGAPIAPAVRVAAQDAFGNTVASFVGGVTVAITAGTGTPGATLSGTTTTAASAGAATFADLSIDFGGGGGVGPGYRLTATASGASADTSTEFTVTLLLVFTVHPTTSPNGSVITPPVQVTAQGAMERTDTSFTGPVTMHIALGTGTGGATLSGTRTVAAVRGMAKFSDLSIDAPGSGYQLRATGVGFLADGYSDPFDIACASDCWALRMSMPTARSDLGVGVVNGILYAVGGMGAARYDIVEAYDPQTNSWTARASMPTARDGLAVGVVNGILYAIGGFNGSWLATVEAYDPVANRWTTKAPMPTPRSNFGVAVVNGILYAVGGYVSGTAVARVEAYDPATDTWSTKTSMPSARFYLGVGEVNGIVYAVGGNPAFYTVEAYDPVANSWSPRASRSTFRQEFGTGVLGGLLYTIGGFDDSTVEAYHPATDSWSPRASMVAPRARFGVGVVNGLLYAVGGYDGGDVRRVEVYRP